MHYITTPEATIKGKVLMQPENEIKTIMEAGEIQGLIESLASQILKEYPDPARDFILIGLHRAGVPLAKRLAECIAKKCGTAPRTGSIDIILYRDDIGMRKTLPPIQETVLPDINEEVVILVDSIIQSGRSVRAALDAITDFGRPARVRLATLMDRGCREFPIRPDFLAREISAPADCRVKIYFSEVTGKPDQVCLTPKKRS